MKPIAPFDNYPSFANGGSRTAPGDAKYALGFVPADTFPAEWANYFFHGATKGVSDLNSAVYSLWNEMGSVLSHFNITPDASDNDQLLEALNDLKAQAILAAHPVGSLYWTSSSENPAITFGGGTWVQIKDRFILAQGDTYSTVNATGGAATVTLTTAQMPCHTHTFTGTEATSKNQSAHESYSWTGTHGHEVNTSVLTNAGAPDGGEDYSRANDPSHYGKMRYLTNSSVQIPSYAWTTNQSAGKNIVTDTSLTVSGTCTGNHNHKFTATGSNSLTGGNGTTSGNASAHNNMPPYIVKYCWERTA